MKNLIVCCVLLVSCFVNAQDLKTIREQYPKAVENTEITAQLDGKLAKVNSPDNAVLLAYKGAVLTLKAKFSRKKSQKKEFFKDGVALIESAIVADPTSVEIRYLRLSVQENSPRFLGYHKNIEEDTQFLLKHYDTISSGAVKAVVKDFVMKSTKFTESEKIQFN